MEKNDKTCERESKMYTPPCKDCTERKANCHSWCEKYTAWKREVQEVKGRGNYSFEAYDLLSRGKNKYQVKKIQRH